MIVRPRPGVAGLGDRLIAPGATTAELALGYAAAVAGVVVAILAGVLHDAPWAAWQYALMAVVGFDLVGGTVANAVTNAKLWWHRPGRTAAHQLGFVLGHAHPFALALLIPGFGWAAAVGVYGAVAVGAVVVLVAPAAVRRPVAFGAAVLAIVFVAGLPGIAPALAWFAPVFVVKLLIAHLVPESPAPPASVRSTPETEDEE